MLSIKQGGIKYHFLSIWHDSTLDWTLVSRTIREKSTHYQRKLISHLTNAPEHERYQRIQSSFIAIKTHFAVCLGLAV